MALPFPGGLTYSTLSAFRGVSNYQNLFSGWAFIAFIQTAA